VKSGVNRIAFGDIKNCFVKIITPHSTLNTPHLN